MRRNIKHLQTRLYLSAGAILLLGMSSAVLIYRSAEPAMDSTLVDEFLNSKRYLHDVKNYGGNASVLADQFSRWFDGLWHGEALAYSIATIAAVVCAVLLLVGYLSSQDTAGEAHDVDSPAEPNRE